MADVVDLSKLKVSELRELCKERGLASTGNKSKLIERLESGTAGDHNEGDDSTVDQEEGDQEEGGIAEEDEDDLLNDDDDEKLDEEDDAEATKAAELQLAEPIVEKVEEKPVEVAPAAEPAAPAPDSKPVAVTTTEPKPEPPAPDVTKKITFSKIVAPAETPKSENKEDKMKILTADEILARRQARFGVQSEEDKKKARAERFGITATTEKGSTAAGKGNIAKAAPPDLEVLKKRAARFGTVVSGQLSKSKEKDLAEKRKARFTEPGKESDAKKKRAERFGLTA